MPKPCVLITFILFFEIYKPNNGQLSNVSTFSLEILKSSNLKIAKDMYSCSGYCQRRRILCSCSEKCEYIGDCCFDYWEQCNSTLYGKIDPIEPLLASFAIQIMRTLNMSSIPMIDSNNLTENEFNQTGYFVYYVKQIDVCNKSSEDADNFEFYKNACINSHNNITLTEKSIVAHSLASRSLIFKNYYCAKCNSIDDHNLIPLNYTIICPPEYDLNIDRDTQLNMNSFKENCKFIYKSFDFASQLIQDSNQDKWNNADEIFTTLFTLYYKNIIYNASLNSDDPGYCYLYILPVVLTLNNLTENSSVSVTFKNLNCLKSWLRNLNASLLDFQPDHTKNLSLFKMSNNNYTINIEILNSTLNNPTGFFLNSKNDIDFRLLYQSYKDTSNRINYVQDLNKTANKIAIINQIDPKFPSQYSSYPLYIYLEKQFHDITPIRSNIINVYNFTIKIELLLEKDFLARVMIDTDIDRTNISLYKSILYKEYVEVIIRRYNLSSSFSDDVIFVFSPSLLNSNSNIYAEIYIPIYLKVSNIEVLNYRLTGLVQLIKDLFNNYFNIFESLKYSHVTSACIINKIFTQASQLIQCNISYAKTYSSSLESFMEFSSFNYFWANNPIYTNYIRMNRVNRVESYNLESLYKLYDLVLTVSQDSLTTDHPIIINFAYNGTIIYYIENQYNSYDACDTDSYNLYYFNKTINDTQTIFGNDLILSYVYNKEVYTIEISYNMYGIIDDYIYLLCVNKSDQINQKIQLLNERFAVGENVLELNVKSNSYRIYCCLFFHVLMTFFFLILRIIH